MNKPASIILGLVLAVIGAALVLSGSSPLVKGVGIAIAVLGIGWIAVFSRR